MPVGIKRKRCPSGEKYDKKTKKCIRGNKGLRKEESPKKNTTKKNLPKVFPKKLNITAKKVSPNKKNATSKKKESPNKPKTPPRNKMTTPPSIPKLAGLKKDMTDYEYKYFKLILGQITNGDLEKGFVHKENKEKHTYTSFYNLHQIVHMFEKEIEYINETHCSGGPKHDDFCFGVDTSEEMIKQLKIYINYFKKCADKSGRVDINDVSILYK